MQPWWCIRDQHEVGGPGLKAPVRFFRIVFSVIGFEHPPAPQHPCSQPPSGEGALKIGDLRPGLPHFVQGTARWKFRTWMGAWGAGPFLAAGSVSGTVTTKLRSRNATTVRGVSLNESCTSGFASIALQTGQGRGFESTSPTSRPVTQDETGLFCAVPPDPVF